jgi:phosphoribosylglycinamide formyltransferase-1
MDRRLEQLSTLCRGFPASERILRGDHATFRVKGKVFAYFLNNHHGDGIVSVCCRSEMGANLVRVQREPQRFYLPAHIGTRGWFGMRLDRGKVYWTEVDAYLRESYGLAAPKKLAQEVETAPAQIKA